MLEDILNDTERADPANVAEVAAQREMARYVAFVVVTDGGDHVGYWLHPDERTGWPAPIVKFDSEGSFSIVNGTTLAEALIGES